MVLLTQRATIPESVARRKPCEIAQEKPVEDVVHKYSALNAPLGAEELVVSCSIGGHGTRSHVQERSTLRVPSRNRTVATHRQNPRKVRDGLRAGAVCARRQESRNDRYPASQRCSPRWDQGLKDKVEAASGLDERSGTRTGIQR